ncbi:ectonucleoside triphosphate diphosphohydrolase 2-like isoform X3 [Varroa destructor]|nr:ectonucleoside triphosphate diphosphohydrolase 2-like isoform X3 [Varroa destructor]
MELRVENQTKDSGGTIIVATNGSTPAPSLLGAACQGFKIPLDRQLGLYTKDNVMLSHRKNVAAYGLSNGDTVYLRPKGERDDLLFLLNWRVLAIGLLLTSTVGSTVLVAIYLLTAGRAPFIYGVVIDAGSSHSEATLYNWNGNKYYGTGKAKQVAHVKNDDSGISDLKPREVQRSIEELLEKIKMHIPSTQRHGTPVYLAATAGMRLLNISSPEEVDLILLAAEAGIKGSGLKFGGAGLLSGIDEGLAAWLSSNYLLDRLPRDRNDPKDLVGAMDCGGASTQIAFEVPFKKQHREFRSLKLYGRFYNVFSRSYLCYGMNEAFNRYIMLLLRNQKYDVIKSIESPCHNQGYDDYIALSKILTPCTSHKELPDTLRGMNQTDLRIIGTSNTRWCAFYTNTLFGEKDCRALGFIECFNKIPISIPDINYVAFSAFTYTTLQLKFQGTSMSEFKQTAQAFCSLDYENVKQDYYSNETIKYASAACFRANYVYTLLNSYNITDSNFKKIHFRKRAKGYNLGWSLGYMINATNAIPEAEPNPALIPTSWLITFLVIFTVVLTVGLLALVIARRRSQRATDNISTDTEDLQMKQTVT